MVTFTVSRFVSKIRTSLHGSVELGREGMKLDMEQTIKFIALAALLANVSFAVTSETVFVCFGL